MKGLSMPEERRVDREKTVSQLFLSKINIIKLSVVLPILGCAAAEAGKPKHWPVDPQQAHLQ